MAVKKHELVADNGNQLDLTALAQYLQLMNEQPNYLPPPQELVKHCQDIVRCLAHTEGPVDQLSELLQPVENFILRIVSTANCNVRNEIFTTILDKFYSYISDPQFEACAATAVVLVILDESDEEAALSSARWMVQQSKNEPAGAGLRAALSCLYCWLPDWHSSSALGFWIVTFIKALEENDEHDVLIETSLDNLPSMFSCFTKPQPIHQNTANVIFHILASLRDSVEAFDRISPVVGEVLVNLASDSGQYSRQLLQDLVDILTAMIDCIISTLEEDGQEMFRNKYTDVILCLERHMATNASKFIKYRIWRIRNIDDDNMVQKTGLLNLGNTCYINSVIQALFVARQFSTYAVTKAITIPYWEKIGELFAHMTHCKSLRLDPEVFCKYLRPTFFSLNRQHDSSEFLGYLLELLQSFEHSQETDFDYSIPPALVEENRFGIISSLISKNEKETEVDSSRRSPSPRPGSSGVSDSNGLKRSLPDNEASPASPPKKKSRSVEPSLPCNKSIIDELFAGVSLTRVTCGECRGSSLSRDMFRDLQLAFPEKPEASMHSVQSLLEYYCSDESLTGDNKYYCQACEKLCDAERSVLIEVKPKYLVLVLKNFKFDVKRQEQAKLLHSVHCNHQVTLHQTRAQSDQATYNLFAAIVHAGTTLNSGHYYTLLCDEDRWYQLNDSLVTYTDSNHVNKLAHASTPYILFYRRSDVEEPEAPTLEQLPSRIRDEIVANNKRYEAFVEKQRQTRQS